MGEEYEERVLSILEGREGWYDRYSSISEFKEDLKQGSLAEEELKGGWILWNEPQLHHSNNTTQLQHKIMTLLKHIASDIWWSHYMVQFWEVVKVEGLQHYLSTSHHPFYVSHLNRGFNWYRQLCMNRVYPVDVDEEQLGVIGRAYRNKEPQSTPDLRLYSTHQFPLRDHAARCGFRAYFALPLFDFHKSQCYGVLELLSHHSSMEGFILSTLDLGLQNVGLRSTHTINFIPINRDTNEMPDKYEGESEIKEMLELAIKAIPRLSLAQVWVSCKECVSMTTNVCCLERASFITSRDRILNLRKSLDEDMLEYLDACEFHRLQMDLSNFRAGLCDVSTSKNPLAHYAEKARLSLCFATCLQCVNNNSNHLYIEFFLQSKCGEDARDDYPLHLLLRIMKMKLKSFEFVPGRGQLSEEFMVRSRQLPNAIECESIDLLTVMDSSEDIFSESNFIKYLETVELCCLRPSSEVFNCLEGWVFRQPVEEELYENDVNCNSLLVMKEKIEHFMKEIATTTWKIYYMVQFWAPKMVEDRCCLETWDQPYALGRLAKGLASFRRKCIKHHYFVDDEAKEEELGPPGRVFRNCHREFFHDFFFYSTKEFSMRNYAVHCGLKDYLVLPVFDEHKQFDKHNCVGVLEFTGFSYDELVYIELALKAAQLRSHPALVANHDYASIDICNIEAPTEIQHTLDLFRAIPHCYKANVWVHNEKGNDSNSRWMKRILSSKISRTVDRIHVEPRIGMLGMVLDCESKSCFCRNICEFIITDQPLVAHERAERCNACFAICLQSCLTGELYVLEFFLNRATYEYLRSFLNFLLPIIKHELKTFKLASGKQLGEELVVEVIEFSEANQLTSYESDQLCVFPITFKSVQYSKKKASVC